MEIKQRTRTTSHNILRNYTMNLPSSLPTRTETIDFRFDPFWFSEMQKKRTIISFGNILWRNVSDSSLLAILSPENTLSFKALNLRFSSMCLQFYRSTLCFYSCNVHWSPEINIKYEWIVLRRLGFISISDIIINIKCFGKSAEFHNIDIQRYDIDTFPIIDDCKRLKRSTLSFRGNMEKNNVNGKLDTDPSIHLFRTCVGARQAHKVLLPFEAIRWTILQNHFPNGFPGKWRLRRKCKRGYSIAFAYL